MIKHSLGIIETVGLVAAIEAADVALKTANVELIGYEISKGYGFVTVKLQGDVSSVNAAIRSAIISAGKVNNVFSWTVIARPDDGIEKLILTDETVGIEKSLDDNSSIKEGTNQLVVSETRKPTCNLCMDPDCPRNKGEIKNNCIHHNQIKN